MYCVGSDRKMIMKMPRKCVYRRNLVVYGRERRDSDDYWKDERGER